MLLIVCTDLIFATKITGTAKSLGLSYAVVRTVDALAQRLATGEVSKVILDLSVTGLDPLAALDAVKAHDAALPVIAFLSHVQAELAQQARDRGADKVLPRSAFSARLPELLQPEST